ncbi:MAG: DUF1573 domain-containing protein [Myxococcales bacterium]|nr:DUF1573 domain-containing protein [Myxococcales bacterium]
MRIMRIPWRLALVTAVTLVAGCQEESSDSTSMSPPTCGSGTVLQAGECVATSTLACGDGTEEKDGECVATATETPLTCGSGTTEEGGACISTNTLSCGEGAEEVDGKCVPSSTITCGPETKEVAGECVPATTLACGANTTEIDGACVSSVLQPGAFSPPLVQLKRLQGANGHLHVDEIRYRPSDKKLFQCSYTFGVMDASAPSGLKYLAENIKHTIPSESVACSTNEDCPGNKCDTAAGKCTARTPGCIHLAWDGDIVYTTHRGNLSNPTFISGWDISKGDMDPLDPTKLKTMKPQQIPVLQEPGESYEGIDVEGGYVYVALRQNGLGVYQRDPATNVLTRVGSLSGLGNTWGLRVLNQVVTVADQDGTVSTVDVSTPTAPKLLGTVEVGGTPHGLDVEGDLIYVAGGPAGLVVIDAADPTALVVKSKTPTLGTAIRVDYSEGHAIVAAWNDTRAFDVSDPASPIMLGGVRLTTDVAYPDIGHPPVTARTLGVAANGNTVFVGNWWVQYVYNLYPERVAPFMVLPEDVNLVDFGPVEAGLSKMRPITVRNQGTAPLTLFNNWTSTAAFAVSPKQMVIPPGGSGKLEVTYKATTGTDYDTAVLSIQSDDPLQPVRTAFLAGNQPGLGVGDTLPETRALQLDGGDWASSDVADKPILLAYFATF